MKKKQILTTAYKPGQVSASLSASGGKGETDKSLVRLFSNPNPAPPADVSPTTAPAITSTLDNERGIKVSKTGKQKKNKTGRNEGKKENTEVTPKTSSNGINTKSTFPIKHETLVNGRSQTQKEKAGVKRKIPTGKDDEDEHDPKRPRRNRKRDKKADKRTIFVGNCPLTADKKTLKRLFKEYGEIETVRFRCAPPADPGLPRRAIVIKKNFHEHGSSYVAYIVYKEEEAAKKALEKNGFVLDGQHLRVDIAALSRKHDKKRSVFIGNLPFTMTEETLRTHFQDCGDITNIRIVRDRLTSLGKGICYIQFESKDSVSLALKLNKSELQGRQLRVMVCTNKPKKKTEKDKKDKESTKPAKQKAKKPSFAPSNASGMSFKQVLKAKKEKRFRKLKKKRENAKKKDGLSAIFGDVPAASKTLKKQKQLKGGKMGKGQRDKTGKKSMAGKRKMSQKGTRSFKGKGKAGKGAAMKKKSGK